MGSRKIYTPYKRIVEALRLQQLDVYRVFDNEKGMTRDVLRLYSPATGKVFLVDLGAPREALTLLDFLGRLEEAMKANKIPVPERVVKQLRAELARAETKQATQQAQS